MNHLSREAIDDVLKDSGFGYLGLASGGRPYVVPMAFGYDGEAFYFQMNSSGRKFDYLDGDARATLTVLRMDRETGVSESVMVEGGIREVLEERIEAAYEALATNASFGTDLSLWGDSFAEQDLRLFVLHPDDVSGRVFGDR